MSDERTLHREFLNRYYGISRHFYDVTRKYYLIGRDSALKALARESWKRLIEVGPGTGRNLRKLQALRPDALLGGVEASDEMLKHAQERCPFAKLVHGFAEDADLAGLLGDPPDRILFSYCLSMVEAAPAALEHARRSLAPGGEVIVVDFADLGGIAPILRGPFRRFLNTFHVKPLRDDLVAKAQQVTYGPGRYYLIARFGRIE